MCTALSLHEQGHYFGRTLDLDCSYGEKVCIVPRNFPLTFPTLEDMTQHYAIIGMAVMAGNTPLFYDGANEKGLCMAGLNFPGNAVYQPWKPGAVNIPPYAFITWVLGKFSAVSQVKEALKNGNLVDIAFAEGVPNSPLHWIVSDEKESVVVESAGDGLHVYSDPVHVMTNNPPFPYQLFQLNNFRSLSPATSLNTFCRELDLKVYSQGLGAIGLPGDVSSMSRFVRIAFNAHNSRCGNCDPVEQFFHLLGSVEMIQGCCRTDEGLLDITVYTSCIHPASGRYYYHTYGNRRIHCVDMTRENLDGDKAVTYELHREPDVFYHNSR